MKNSTERGRPSLEDLEITRVVFRVAITLHEGDDDDLIDWFNAIPPRKRASFVKTALRQGGMTDTQEQEEFNDLITDDLLDDLLGAL